MKKIVLSLIFILTIFVLPTHAFAQDNQEPSMDDTAKVMKEKTQIATPAAKIQYDLAYPGTLPDSPFYKLKLLRDRIASFLISDPKKKTEYLLLQTDKGILAAAILVDKGNTKLAAETALKAENNYTLLTQELGKFPRKPDNEFFKKLQNAALKHQEVLDSLSKRVKGDDKKTFEAVKDFSKRNWETIKDYQEQI